MASLITRYRRLPPVERVVAPYLPAPLRPHARVTIILFTALIGWVLAELWFISRPWRSFEAPPIALPEPPETPAPGQPWPTNIPTRALAGILPPDLAARLPADAAIPADQQMLGVFQVTERLQSLNTPVSQSWLHDLINPGGDPVTTESTVWCGFDLRQDPATRVCTAALPVPVFGRVVSGPCLSGDAFALAYATVNTELCTARPTEAICENHAEWSQTLPSVGDTIVPRPGMQCAASVLLPHLVLWMQPDGIRVEGRTKSYLHDTLGPDAEHQDGFSRYMVQLTHAGADENGRLSWSDLQGPDGEIPVVLDSRVNAAGLFWQRYQFRQTIQRGTDGKAPRRTDEFLDTMRIPLPAPNALEAAADFLTQGEMASVITDSPVFLPEACTGPPEPTFRANGLACPQSMIGQILIPTTPQM